MNIKQEEIKKVLEIKEFMQLAETGFDQWNDPEEDIYSNEPEDS